MTGIWRGAWLAAALALVSGAAGAQSTYAYRNDTFSYDTPSGSAISVGWHAGTDGVNLGAPGCTQYPNGDDDWADIAFPSGFTFTFGGTAYSGVRVYSNGILAFGSDVSGFHRNYTPQALPITGQALNGPAGCPRGVPVRLMQAYWIDIVAGTANGTSGASVRYELLGTAPNRRLVISWANVKLYNQAARYNFQIALYESTAGVNGNFRYQYTSGSSDGANATVGVQLSTADFTQYSFNQQFIDTTNGTAILWYPANQLATKTAEYRFDESVWNGTAGEIKDTSGSSRDASRAGSAASTANGRLCRGADIPANTSNNTRDAVATPLTIGQTGSIDFWFRSDTAWNSTDAMLFDATTTANRPFFLMKRSTGALRFAVSDSAGTTLTANTGNQTFAANTWHHIGVTWNIRGGTNLSVIQVFIDGNLATSTRGTTTGTLPGLGTLYIGDNRTSGVTPSNGTGNSANGIIDEFYVYGIDVSRPQIQADMNLTRDTCTALDHFHIIHDGSAACGVANITIEAHDLNHTLFPLAGTTMSVVTSTGHGTWSTVTAINPINNTGPGTALYTFANESSVVLALTNPYVETVNINVTSGNITEHSYVAAICSAPDYTFGTVCDADLVFASCVSGYECVATGLTYNNLTTSPTARNPLYTKLAGAAFSIDVIALNSSGNRVTSYAADADKTVTVALVDGASGSCAANAALATATLTYTKAGQPTDQGRKVVDFTAVATAHPNLQCRVTDANVAPTVTACSSDRFAIRPQSLSVSSTMNADPAGTNTTATPSLAAGNNFTLSATGVAGYSGTPTIDATKLEAHSGAITTGSVLGTFSAANIATGISSGSTFTYDEVGYFRFAPYGVIDVGFTAIDQPNDCTDDFSYSAVGGKFGCKFGNIDNTEYFGRFIPHHFDTTVTQGCAAGSFTYSAQPFDLSVTARNATGGSTLNYSGGFAKAAALTEANGVAGGTLVPAGIAAGTFASGVATLARSDASPPTYSFTRTTPDHAPATIRPRAVDTEGVSSLAGTEGTALIRIGRLRLSNVYGSLSPLTVPVERQYWTGNSWIRNADDSCTTLVANNVLLSPAGWAATIVGGNIQLVPTGPGSVTVCADLGTDHGVACAATSAALPWLQSRWPGAATWDNDPSATATFGVFSPDVRRGIYNREMY